MKAKTAKQRLRAYRVFGLVCVIILCALVGVATWFLYPIGIIELLLFVAVATVAAFFISFYANKKWILSALTDELDAPLYYEIIKTGKFRNKLALEHLQAEFHTGNYSNAVAICNQKLADPKIGKNYPYIYLSFLANVYFRMDDSARLSEVCQQVNRFLADQKKVSKSLKNWTDAIPFYEAYLSCDWDACDAFLNPEQPLTSELARVTYSYLAARVALKKGETDAAKALFQEVAQKAPKLYLATHAQHALGAIEENRPYSEGIEPVTPNETYVIPTPTKSQKAVKVLLWIVFFLGFGYTLMVGVIDRQWEREYEEYLEEIRVMVEVDHDNVVVVQDFDLMYEDEIVDSMFVCEVDSGMILAASYVYMDEEELHYDTLVTISKEDLLGEEPISFVAEFESVTSYINIVMGFYTQVDDIPVDVLAVYRADVHGKTVYIAAISMEEIPH